MIILSRSWYKMSGCKTSRSKMSGAKHPGLKCPGAKRPGPKNPGPKQQQKSSKLLYILLMNFIYLFIYYLSSHLSPLTLEVVGAPQMTLQQYLSILPCLPLPSGNLQTPFPSIRWCYLPISSSVFLSFLLLSLSLAELSSPCQRILRCGHTIWVSVSLPWLGDHHALQLHSGFCCEPPRSSHGLCRKCSEVSYSISSEGLGSFSLFLLSRSNSHRHKER